MATIKQQELTPRHQHAKQTRQLIKANDKIKAVLQMRKFQQYQKISQYIKHKVEDSRIKRTLYMRNKFMLDHSHSAENSKANFSTLSIDTCTNMKHVFQNKLNKNQNYSNQISSHVDKLMDFYDRFQKGQMQQQYDILLKQFLQEYENQIKAQNKQQWIRKASKIIKKKLFQRFIQQHDSLHQTTQLKQVINKSLPQQQNKTEKIKLKKKHYEQNPLKNSQTYQISLFGEKEKLIQKIQKHQRQWPKTVANAKIDLPQLPYHFQQPSKFSQRRFSSINKICSTQLQNLNKANKVKNKSRRLQQISFLNRIKYKPINSQLINNMNIIQ